MEINHPRFAMPAIRALRCLILSRLPRRAGVEVSPQCQIYEIVSQHVIRLEGLARSGQGMIHRSPDTFPLNAIARTGVNTLRRDNEGRGIVFGGNSPRAGQRPIIAHSRATINLSLGTPNCYLQSKRRCTLHPWQLSIAGVAGATSRSPPRRRVGIRRFS